MFLALFENPLAVAALVFFARIADVSLGTIRTLMVVRGYRKIAVAIGLIEVTIWVSASGWVLKKMDQWYLVLAYSLGFAVGNLIGMTIEAWLALGSVMVFAVSEARERALAPQLREQGFSVTVLSGQGNEGNAVEVVLCTEERKTLPILMKSIREADPQAFITVKDIRDVDSAELRSHRIPSATGWRNILKKK